MQRARRPGIKYWFPARERGAGWGLPHVWQGWIVLDAFIGIFIISLFIVLFGGSHNLIFGVIGFVFDATALLFICSQKGEPRRQR